ncbi:MAG: creatininase family protein, partial [Kofleriaceae bacterium]|nr:creatininase family protein [Kofleriaceae bacterium]
MSETRRFFIEYMNSPHFGELAASGELVVLLPVGSVEPHGPHMSLATDTVISVGAAEHASLLLEKEKLVPVIAPPIPYGVTDCAAAF